MRAQSWHALSRIFSDHSEVASRVHQKYMEATLQGLADPIERVQTKNLGAFLYFGEALEPVIMETYSPKLLEELIKKIQTSNHRGVTEECITAIAVIAGSIQTEFAAYYDSIMPMLKEIIVNQQQGVRMRGKAFECISLFGVAVGKEKFKPDVVQCLRAMVQSGGQTSQLEAKDKELLNDYLKDAVERVAGVMEEDMGQFLPDLLPNFLAVLDINNANKQFGGDDDDDDDDHIVLKNGAKVKSAYFKEMTDAAETVGEVLVYGVYLCRGFLCWGLVLFLSVGGSIFQLV